MAAISACQQRFLTAGLDTMDIADFCQSRRLGHYCDGCTAPKIRQHKVEEHRKGQFNILTNGLRVVSFEAIEIAGLLFQIMDCN